MEAHDRCFGQPAGGHPSLDAFGDLMGSDFVPAPCPVCCNMSTYGVRWKVQMRYNGSTFEF